MILSNFETVAITTALAAEVLNAKQKKLLDLVTKSWVRRRRYVTGYS